MGGDGPTPSVDDETKRQAVTVVLDYGNACSLGTRALIRISRTSREKPNKTHAARVEKEKITMRCGTHGGVNNTRINAPQKQRSLKSLFFVLLTSSFSVKNNK
jgi:hypothetical protein